MPDTTVPVSPQGHLAIEAALLVMLVVLLSQQAYRPGNKTNEQLTDKVTQLLQRWMYTCTKSLHMRS